MNVLLLVLGAVIGLVVVAALLALTGFAAYILASVLRNSLRRPDQLPVIAKIALRNLFASRLKTAIVGGIIVMGAVLIVVGTSFVGSITQGMSRSVIGSAAGDVQVYSSKSKDKLAIWGSMGGDSDLAALDDFTKIKNTLMKVPNVKAVVPMGISGAMVTSGNTIDLALGDLRDAVNKEKAGNTSPQVKERIDAQKAHLQHIVDVLKGDQKNRQEISVDNRAENAEESAAVQEASAPNFWSSFDQDAYGHLEFLENKIAPQAADADLIYLRYIGTDMAAFEKSFDRMQIVDGTAVPQGARGFLFAKTFYEDNLKLKNARRLDHLKEEIETNHKKIAVDEELQRWVHQNVTETREIVLQLDDVKAKQMVERLQKITGSNEPALEKLLATFFATTDENFEARYKGFYEQIAPLLDLYRIRVGDTLTIKAFGKSGYVKSVNVKVFGTFQFRGLEKSSLAGSLNLVDLQSFRDLYGFLTADSMKEVEAIKKQAGVKSVDRAKAEDELFGDAPAGTPTETGRVIEAQTTPGVIDEKSDTLVKGLHDKEVQGRLYSEAEIEQGSVLNAAVFLTDPGNARKTMADIESAGKDAGLPLQAVSWQEAAGNIGLLVLLFWAILVISAIIIAFVAVIIINNALLTATLERVREFGTLRAIGAQKPFILTTVVVEAMVMGAVFGGLGAVVGSIIVAAFHVHGIAAFTDIAYFFFSGPRFLPNLSIPSIFIAVVAMFFISAFASLIPAFLAMRVSPVKAMQSED